MCWHLNWSPILLICFQMVNSMSSLINQHSYFLDTRGSGTDSDVADIIVSKGYLPKDKDLPKTSIVKNVENDVTYLLSKLSDEELLKLLNDQPKKSVYDVKDLVKVAVDPKSFQDNKLSNADLVTAHDSYFQSPAKQVKRFKTINERAQDKQDAFFRLDDKPVESYNMKANVDDQNVAALQKITNLLNSRPLEDLPNSDEEEDEKKQLLFDILVEQLKTLCCKRSKPRTKSLNRELNYKSVLSDLLSQKIPYLKPPYGGEVKPIKTEISTNEFMFLIINDEIKANGSDELVSVDPESLEKNSSVLLLGPITTPMTNSQLKTVMTRITNELSRPEYLPLLQEISEGTLSGNNVRLMKSLVSGPDTRRYIKPHRCNYQSPLAKIHSRGPKWIICTGYLNLNTPSLYDRK